MTSAVLATDVPNAVRRDLRFVAPRAAFVRLSAALACLLGGDAVAQPPSAASSPLTEWRGLTGDWGGLRDELENRGVEIGARYLFDWSAPWHGGVRKRDTARGLLAFWTALDLETLAGLPGIRLHAEGQDIHGRDGSADAGDIQVLSNIDAPSRTQLAELWGQARVARGALTLKLGKIDANTEFAVIEAAGDFSHSSAGFSPTIVAFPSYPDPAFGAVARTSHGPAYLTGGVFDGALADGIATGKRGPSDLFRHRDSDSWFLIAEAGARFDRGRFGLGLWHSTADFARFAGGTKSGLDGLYAVGEVTVWRGSAPAGETRPALTLLGTGGVTDEDVAEIGWHALLGATWRGALPGRPDDSLGLMLSHASLSDAPAAGFASDETALEVYYNIRATRFLVVQPGLHYIVDPSGRADIDDAFVGLLRIAIDF